MKRVRVKHWTVFDTSKVKRVITKPTSTSVKTVVTKSVFEYKLGDSQSWQVAASR